MKQKKMKRSKRIPVMIFVVVVLFCVVGCAEQEWEYKVKEFSRDPWGSIPLMELELKSLAKDGWEYVGPLANNGINAQFVAFRRPKGYEAKGAGQ